MQELKGRNRKSLSTNSESIPNSIAISAHRDAFCIGETRQRNKRVICRMRDLQRSWNTLVSLERDGPVILHLYTVPWFSIQDNPLARHENIV